MCVSGGGRKVVTGAGLAQPEVMDKPVILAVSPPTSYIEIWNGSVVSIRALIAFVKDEISGHP